MSKGNIYIISAPSGAGKTTLCNLVMRQLSDISFSVSHTTRAPRDGEIDGVHYHFVLKDQFVSMRDSGDFLEWACVHDNLYGTSRPKVLSDVNSGRDVILDIDVQGAVQVREQLPEVISIFIMPPSLEELERRLRGRGSDDEDVIKRRLTNARQEILKLRQYDYTIINDDLQDAASELLSIFKARRCLTDSVIEKNRWLSQLLD